MKNARSKLEGEVCQVAGCCQFKFRCQLFREQGRFEGAILERFPESFDSSLTVEIVFDKYLNFNAKPSNVNSLRRYLIRVLKISRKILIAITEIA